MLEQGVADVWQRGWHTSKSKGVFQWNNWHWCKRQLVNI